MSHHAARIDPMPPNHETVRVMRQLRAQPELLVGLTGLSLAELRSQCRDRLTLTDQDLFFAEWVWLREWLIRTSRDPKGVTA